MRHEAADELKTKRIDCKGQGSRSSRESDKNERNSSLLLLLTEVGYSRVAGLHLVGHTQDGRDLDKRRRDDLAVEYGVAEVAGGLGAVDPPAAGGGWGGGGGVSSGGHPAAPAPAPAAPRGGRHGYGYGAGPPPRLPTVVEQQQQVNGRRCSSPSSMLADQSDVSASRPCNSQTYLN